MRQINVLTIGIMVFLGAGKALAAEQPIDKFPHITQDDITLDLDTGKLTFNAEEVSLNQLKEKVSNSYSISLNAVSFLTDQPITPASNLLSVVEIINDEGITPERVRVHFFLHPGTKERVLSDDIEMLEQGEIHIINSPKGPTFKKLPNKQSSSSSSHDLPTNYSQLLELYHNPKLENRMQIVGLTSITKDLVKVEVLVSEMLDDGTRRGLSRPSLTARPGRHSLIRITENLTGQENYRPETDRYHQADLADLGVQLSVKPQIIGDYIRVSGVVILCKALDIGSVFQVKDGLASCYASKKIVIPFSVVISPDAELIEFPAVNVEGTEILCKIKATVVK